jgi:hypothetical protein
MTNNKISNVRNMFENLAGANSPPTVKRSFRTSIVVPPPIAKLSEEESDHTEGTSDLGQSNNTWEHSTTSSAWNTSMQALTLEDTPEAEAADDNVDNEAKQVKNDAASKESVQEETEADEIPWYAQRPGTAPKKEEEEYVKTIAQDESKLFVAGVSDLSTCSFETQMKIAAARERARLKKEAEEVISRRTSGVSLKERMAKFNQSMSQLEYSPEKRRQSITSKLNMSSLSHSSALP